jgi:SAM-dependent methyltransferase
MTPTLARSERSFRDPGGFAFRSGKRILRAVEPSAFENLVAFLETPAARSFVDTGQLVDTFFPESPAFVEQLPARYRLAEHEAVEFPSFPAEWPAEMLAAAGFLTLDLAERTLRDGWRLKDATPYNILFRGPAPVFVDVLSFERREAGDGIWPAYAQFVRTFLLPLLAAHASPSSAASTWLAHRDGLEPEDVYRSLSWPRRLTPPALTLASIPAWFSARAESDASLYRARAMDPERASFTLETMFRGLRRQLLRLAPRSRTSRWSCYLQTQSHYSAEQFREKETFVDSVLRDYRLRRVLDVGANTGHFSELAATAGAKVVAIDSDEAAVGRIWRRASEKKLAILPLIVDLCRPTPALGWRNRESPSFLDRASGAFDLVMMLAVLHHMLVTERVPLEELVALAADLTTGLLLVEFVAPEDPMFRQLVRGRDALYAHLNAAYFEDACARYFEIVRKHPIPHSARTLYLLRKNS